MYQDCIELQNLRLLERNLKILKFYFKNYSTVFLKKLSLRQVGTPLPEKGTCDIEIVRVDHRWSVLHKLLD